jgi:iron(III) transport system substrate-binding protein
VRIASLRGGVALIGAGLLGLAVAACGADEPTPSASPTSDSKVTVYSGRSESLVQPVLDEFSQRTGIAVEVRYANTPTLATQLLEEGSRTPADVFFSQDAGALGAVANAGLFTPLPSSILDTVPAQYRASGGQWVGVTARSRVLAYNADLVPAGQLPASVFDLTRPEWAGKVGIAPTNASFQTFITAVVVQHGEDRAKEFLAGLKANAARIYPGNAQILEDVNNGALAVGLINHYYLGELAQELGVPPESLKAKLHFFPNGDTGALVNVAGVGILTGAADDADALALVEFLLTVDTQTRFAQQTFEYPVVAGAPAPAYVPPLSELTVPDVDLNQLNRLQNTISLITDAGLTP